MSNEVCVEISSFRQSRTLLRHCCPKRQHCRSNRQQSCLLLRQCCFDFVPSVDRALSWKHAHIRCVYNIPSTFRPHRPTWRITTIALLTWQKISPGSRAVATARIAPKICQGQPPTMYSESQMSSKSVHFWRSYSRTREHRLNAP